MVFARLHFRAWTDPEFRKRLENDPLPALAEMGIAAPEGVEVKVLFDDLKTTTFIIPPKPSFVT